MGVVRVLFLLLLIPCLLGAQSDTGSTSNASGFWSRLWVSGQANFIRQDQPSFDAKYNGPNSLSASAEHATSRVLTLYTGFRIFSNLEFLYDLEETGGDGLSHALGVAGFTNVDVVRNPTLGPKPYTSRIMLHWTVPLSSQEVETTRGPLSLAPTAAARRLEFRLGKMSTVDFFDINAIGSDSHLQFMNWALVNNGAYDYAADTRGYTYGLVVEYDDRWGALRFGEMLMPTVANGIQLDWNIARARGEQLEGEFHTSLFRKHATVLRPLAFVNHANMGSYRDAIDGYLSGNEAKPDITAYRKQGRAKYGFGFNVEQELTSLWRVFGRLGWNDGRDESFAYTEIDRTASFGSDFYGTPWHRKLDKIGAAFVTSGLSGDHRRYLQLGGLGFIIGDGGLTYGHETIVESYYDAHLYGGIYAAFDLQHVNNPGFNQARGPVWVTGIRFHLEGTVPFH